MDFILGKLEGKMTREELIQELIVQLIQIEGKSGDMNYIRGVADFILSRERLILEKIGKPLRELHAMVKGECPSLLNEDSGGNARLDMEIDSALAIIEKESKQ